MRRNDGAHSAARRRRPGRAGLAGSLARLGDCITPALVYLGWGRSALRVTTTAQGEGGAFADAGVMDDADIPDTDAADVDVVETDDAADDAPPEAEAGPPCTDVCFEGDTECQAGGVSACEIGSDGCTAW